MAWLANVMPINYIEWGIKYAEEEGFSDAKAAFVIVKESWDKVKEFWPQEHIAGVNAIPVEWLVDRANDITRAPLYRRFAQMILYEWQKEQEAR